MYLILASYTITYEEFKVSLDSIRTAGWSEIAQDLNFTEFQLIVCGSSPRELKPEISIRRQDIDHEDLYSHTALWYACGFGNVDHVRELLNCGANPNGGWGHSPLE